jgi:hypothetical protein
MLDRTIEHHRLLKEVLVHLSGLGYFVWSNSTGAMKTKNRYQRYGLIGSADILGITPDGTFLALEIKTGKAVQSKQQKKFEARVKKNKGIYKVVRSFKDLEDLIDGKSNKPRNTRKPSKKAVGPNKNVIRPTNGKQVPNVERNDDRTISIMGAVGTED